MSTSSVTANPLAAAESSISNHPSIVKEIISAQIEVLNAVKSMTSSKEKCRMITQIVQHIVTCVEHSSLRAHYAGRPLIISIPARCALSVTKETFNKCANFISDSSCLSAIERIVKKKDTSTTIANYLAACIALSNILEVKDGVCELLEDPTRAGSGLSSGTSKRDLELEVQRLSPAYDGMKALILGMVNMTDGLPWPLKAAPQTLLQIIAHVENGHAAAARITLLLTEVQAHWDLVAQFYVPEGGSEKLRPHVEAFFEVIFGVFIRLRVLQATHPVVSRIAIDSYNATLSEESERVAAAMRTLESTRDWILFNSVAQMTGMSSAVDQKAAVNATIDLDVSSVPPPRPSVFHGRDDLVKSLVEQIIHQSTEQTAANVGIIGNGGIGKTSLAQAVLWERVTVEHFGPRRFFVSCEPLVDAAGVGAALAKVFNLPSANDALKGIIAHLELHGRTLLVLDNLETVWLVPDDRTRSQVELLLRHLAAIPTLTLVITSRGIILPGGIRWSNAAYATLEPFSADAAMETFDAIAGTSENDDEHERTAAMELILSVDCMPLAVTLLARLAQCGEKPSELLSHWKRSHTAMLQTDPLAVGRESNVAASIALSIKLLRAGSNNEEPLQLLAICAHLPSGLRSPVFDQLRPEFKDLDLVRRSLRSLALISVGSEGELKMLSPIRHFILKQHPISAQHLATMRRIYFDIAASAPKAPSEQFVTQSAAVAPEYENLTVLLLYLISTEEPSQPIVDAVTAVSEYSYWTTPSVTLRETLRTRLDGHPIWLAACCENLGRMYLQMGQYSAAISVLHQATNQYAQLENSNGTAFCMYLSAQCQQVQGSYDPAITQYSAARDNFVRLGNTAFAAHCLKEIGSITCSQRKYPEAAQYLISARSTFALGAPGDRLSAAQCTSLLGLIYIKEGNYAAAETELQTARSEFHAIGNQLGVGRALQQLGDLRRRQRDFPLAEELLFSAREICVRMGQPYDQADCTKYLGLLRRDQGRVQEALEAFRNAMQIFERIGVAPEVELCKRDIAALHNTEM
ncbi:hypothetical protein BKA62DRAFT_711990 [Auriculariales sp. MPI-PUGE-AT-0066]|nr:hypothetical protein BKA62DRAFT_711990 [Auriculariales sp. MPI-PUGE-AT-0066]